MKISILISIPIALVVLLVAPLSAEVPQVIKYQGYLTDDMSQPMDTAISMTFVIYDDSSGMADVWTEGHSSVQVSGGLFEVILGATNPLGVAVFDSPDRFLEVQVGDGPTILPRVRMISAPFAIHTEYSDDADMIDSLHGDALMEWSIYDADQDGQIDENAVAVLSVPVGAIIDWWRPDNSLPLPDNFQICDGSLVDDIESPLNGHTLPDLTQLFVKGITDVNDIGVTGGSVDHQHTIDNPEHDHDVVVDHDHPNMEISLSSSGNHSHSISMNHAHGYFLSAMAGSHTHGVQSGGPFAGGTNYSMDTEPDHQHGISIPAYYNSTSTSSGGSHTHTASFDLPAFNATNATSLSSPGTMPSTIESNLPPYIGLLKLMRIK
ncbi:MAG: hypothetical protein GY841_04805 [FCB group bacterium]|nr:hypothetical protein [FCB group bacterium]